MFLNGSNQLTTCTSGSGTDTLQSAYTNGNTITTTDARNIAFTFADTTTDQSLLLTQQGTVPSLILNDTNGVTNTALDVRSGGSTTLTISEAGTLSTTGNISTTGSGTITSAGLLTGSAGLTVTGGATNISGGTANINVAGTSNTAIGNGTGTFALISNGGLNVTTAGALTGVSSIDTISTSATALGFAGTGSITSGAGTALSLTSGTTGAVTLDSGTTGTVNVGTGNNAKTVNIGTGNAGNIINIGTNNTVADTIAIGSTLDTLTLTGNSSSTFVLNGTTIDATEFNLLNGRDTALVDTTDAVNTAITGTGALGSGSIAAGFGSIDVGADPISTTGTLTGGTLVLANASPTISTSTTDSSLSVNGNGTGAVNIGGTSTGNILLGGGVGSTGCTLTNSTGAFACTSTITGSNISGTNTGDVTLSGENYLSIAGQVITANPVNLSNTNVTGTLAAARFGALTGDVTSAGGTYATTIAANAVTNAKFRQSAGLSVVGRATNTTGDVADITAANNNEVLFRSGTSLVFGTLPNASLTNSTINLAGNSGSGSVALGGTFTITGAGINNAVASGSTITITGTEADTLAAVTGRGATTSTAVTLNGGATIVGTTLINNSGTANTTIGNSAGGTITIGASSGSNLILDDAQWNVSGAGAANFASIGAATPGTGVFTTLSATGDVSFNDSGADTILIGQSGATDDIVTIAGDLSLTDDQWSITSAGVATGLSGTNTGLIAGDLSCTNCIGATEIDESTILSTNLSDGANIAHINVAETITGGWTFSTAATTFATAINANGGITFDNASDTLGAHTLAGTLDANTNIITNIGNAGTDFLSNGGLTLANAFSVTTGGATVTAGGITLTSGALAVNSDSITSDGTLVINAAGNVDVDDTLNANAITSDAGVSIAAGNSYTGAGAVTVSSAAGTALTVDSGTTGTVNLGTGNNAKSINIGTGTAGNVMSIGTDNTTKDTINIGSALDDVAITGDQWSVTNAGVLTVQSCTGCAAISFTTWDTIGDPLGNGAINFGATTQTMDWTTALDGNYFSYNFTNNGGVAGNDNGVSINNAVSTNAALDLNTENLLLLQQLDTTTAGTTVVDNALKIDSAGSSAITDAIEITNSAGNLTNGINIADTGGGAIDKGILLSGTFTTAGIDAGNATIINVGNAGTDFLSTGGLTLANTLTVTTGGVTITAGALAVNSDSITSDGALTINATTTDIQDPLTADSLTTDVGGVSIAAGQSYTGAGAVTLSCAGGGNALTLDTGGGTLSICNSANCDTVTLATNTDADTISIGDTLDTFSLASTGLNVTSGGALTGVASLDTISTSATALGFAGTGTITSGAGTALSFTSGTTGAVTVDSGTTGAVNLGTGNNAKSINIGTGNAGDIISIGTDNTTKDTINIGSALDDVAITGDQWSVTNAGVLTVVSCTGCSGGSTLQGAYNGGNTIETASNNAVAISETTGTAGLTGDLLQLTFNQATGGTTSGDALEITLDGVDADASTGNGIHLIVDQSQSTGNLALFEQDTGEDLFVVNENGALTLAGGQAADISSVVTSGAGAALTLKPGTSTGASTNGGATTISGGDGSGTTSVTGGALNLTAGSATGGSGTRNGGIVTINGGDGATADGQVTIGSANTTAINLGNGTNNTTLTLTGTGLTTLGGNLTVSGTSILGTSATTVTLGSTGADNITLGNGGADTILIGNGAAASTITIGNASATGVSITDNNWSINTSGVANFGASATIAGTGDGTDALILTLGDILVSNGDLDLSGGDFNVTLDAGDTANISKTGASAGDVLSVVASSVNAIDGIDVALTSTADSGADNVNGLNIVWTESGDADVFTALNLPNTTTTNSVTQGLIIGTGYDVGISVGSGGVSIAAGALAVNSDSITSDGTLTIDSTGIVQLGTDDDFLPQLGAGSADIGATGTRWDNIFAVAGDFSGTVAVSDLTCTNCLDFTEFADALNLDASTSITQNAAETLTFTNSGTGNTIFNLTSSGDFDIQDAGTSAFFVRDDGFVGIGTTGPAYKLDVVNADATAYSASSVVPQGLRVFNTDTTANSVAPLYFTLGSSGTSYAAITGLRESADNSALTFRTEGSNVLAEAMRITSTGNVGIGDVTPDAKFDVDATAITGATALDASGILLTNQSTSAIQRGFVVTNADDAANAVTEAGIVIDNAETTANTLTDYLLITKATTGADTTADAIDVSDADLFNAINVGDNNIVGTGAVINFTGFDVSSAGNITVAAAEGLDTNGSGVLEIAKANATSLDLCNSANCDTIDIGNLATTDADTINIGDILDTVNVDGATVDVDANVIDFTLSAGTTDFTINGLDADSNLILSGGTFTTCAALTTVGNVLTCGAAGASTLQQAYVAGNTIDITSGEGALDIDAQTANVDFEIGEGSDTGDFRVWDGTANWIFVDESADTLALGAAAGAGITLGGTGILTSNPGSLTVTETLTANGAFDSNGEVTIADTNIAFDGASTIFTTTGTLGINSTGTITVGDGGDAVNISSTTSSVTSSTATDAAISLSATANAGGIHILAGDNEVAAVGTDEAIELRASSDVIAALTAGGSLVIDGATTNSTNVDGSLDINVTTVTTNVVGAHIDFQNDEGAGASNAFGMVLNVDNNATTNDDTVYGLYLDNENSGDNDADKVADALLVIDNSDTDNPVIAGIQFVNAGGGFTSGINMANMTIDNIGAAGTDFTNTGGLTLAGTLDANGQVDLGDGGDAILIDGNALTLQTTGAGSDITINAVDQVLLTDFANCTLTTVSNVLTCGGAGGVLWDAIGNPAGNGDILMAETVQSLDWNTAATAAGFDGLTVSITNDAGTDSTTQRAFVVENRDASGATTTESLIVIDNQDADETVTNGLLIEQSAAGTITNAIQILETAGSIGTGINIGAGLTIGINANANTIENIGNAGTDFLSTGGLTLANTLTVTSGGATITAGALAVNSGSITSTGTLTIDSSGIVQLGTDDDWTVTGDVSYTLSGSENFTIDNGAGDSNDVNINLSSAGDFEIEDAGVAFVTFDDSGVTTFTRAGAGNAILVQKTDAVANTTQLININYAPGTASSGIGLNITGGPNVSGDIVRILNDASTGNAINVLEDVAGVDTQVFAVNNAGKVIINQATANIFPQFFARTNAPSSASNFASNGDFAIGALSTTGVGGRIWIRANNLNFRWNSTSNIADYSEFLRQEETSEPGDVMVLSNNRRQTVKPSSGSYDQNVLGVITIYGSSHNNDNCWDEVSCDRSTDPNWANVGMLGQVYTKISTENGEIKPGDPLTTSSSRGVAMKALKQGRIVGYALDHFDGTVSGADMNEDLPIYTVREETVDPPGAPPPKTVKIGKIIILLQASWYDPSAPPPDIGDLTFEARESSESSGGQTYYDLFNAQTEGYVEAQIAVQDGLIANLKAGSIEGLDLITERATIKTVKLEDIQTVEDGGDIALKLTGDGKFIVEDQAGEPAITFDAEGNATFSGTLTASKIKANQIEGLEILTNKISKLDENLALLVGDGEIEGASSSATIEPTTEPASEPVSEPTLAPTGMIAMEGLTIEKSVTIGEDLQVEGGGIIHGVLNVIESITTKNLIVGKWADFVGRVIFRDDTTFVGRPTFNKDSGGSVIIKKGSITTSITFEKEYTGTPIVNATISQDETSNEALEEAILQGDIRYIVTKRSKKGFTIKLNKAAPADITFSWSALAVGEAEGVTADPSPEASPPVEPTPLPSPTGVLTPTQPPPSPLVTQEPAIPEPSAAPPTP